MNFEEYQTQIEKFCVYPNVGPRGIVYPILGLIGETDEFLSKYHANPMRQADIYELGDMAFYIARCFSHLDFPIVSPAGYTAVPVMEFARFAMSLAEITKKIIRDNNEEKWVELEEALRVMYITWRNLCLLKAKATPESVMQANYDKLYDRMQRGVIKGDGDNR